MYRHGHLTAAQWPRSLLTERLHAKHRESVFVEADVRRGPVEEFHYVAISYGRTAGYDRFEKLLMDGAGQLDLLMYRTPGGVRDHGYLFRVMENRLPELFEVFERHDL